MPTISQAEEHVIQAFVELIVKLNEASFRPLYRRLFDWAFGNGSHLHQSNSSSHSNFSRRERVHEDHFLQGLQRTAGLLQGMKPEYAD
jgi:hypothetical protein